MAATIGGNCGLVTQKVILVLILGDPVHPAQQVVGIKDDETSGAVGELIENLLIVRSARGKRRNNLAGLIVLVV